MIEASCVASPESVELFLEFHPTAARSWPFWDQKQQTKQIAPSACLILFEPSDRWLEHKQSKDDFVVGTDGSQCPESGWKCHHVIIGEDGVYHASISTVCQDGIVPIQIVYTYIDSFESSFRLSAWRGKRSARRKGCHQDCTPTLFLEMVVCKLAESMDGSIIRRWSDDFSAMIDGQACTIVTREVGKNREWIIDPLWEMKMSTIVPRRLGCQILGWKYKWKGFETLDTLQSFMTAWETNNKGRMGCWRFFWMWSLHHWRRKMMSVNISESRHTPSVAMTSLTDRKRQFWRERGPTKRHRITFNLIVTCAILVGTTFRFFCRARRASFRASQWI